MDENKVKKVEADQEKAVDNDYLVLKLEKPIEYEGQHVDVLNLSKIRDMTMDDLGELYDLYVLHGGNETMMQECSIKFMKLAAQKATGYPMELLGRMSIRDAIKMKSRLYRFFYLTR